MSTSSNNAQDMKGWNAEHNEAAGPEVKFGACMDDLKQTMESLIREYRRPDSWFEIQSLLNSIARTAERAEVIALQAANKVRQTHLVHLKKRPEGGTPFVIDLNFSPSNVPQEIGMLDDRFPQVRGPAPSTD